MKTLAIEEAVGLYEMHFGEHYPPSYHPLYVAADAARDAEMKPTFLSHQEGESIFYFGFLLTSIPGKPYFDIQSPYGYGGPCFIRENEKFVLKCWKIYDNWCKSNGIVVEMLRFHPLVPINNYPGETIINRNTVYIDTSVTDPFAGYSSNARNMIRKAMKQDVEIKWARDFESMRLFKDLYIDTMHRLKAANLYFFPDSYYESLLAWSNCEIAICFYKDQAVAGALFLFSPFTAEYHLSAADDMGRKIGASNLLIHSAVLKAKSKGIPRVYLGGGTDAEPDNPLLSFKERFSSLKAAFHLGKQVFLYEVYQDLKRDWEKSTGHLATRILFYRD